MALDINGYNATFKSFVEFAQQSVNANDAKAVANAKIQRPLDGRKIVSVTNAFTDSVHNFTRNTEQFVANERTRALFKKAIIDMFGGESKIPASVKKAMQLSDYGSGKPLTARRIMAVKAAIDVDGTAAVRSARISLETFSPEVEKAALAFGYSKKELPKLARAAHFLAEATGKSEMEAMREVAEPGSKANRLMSYGGRFMKSAENFANGLRLMDSFAAWHEELGNAAAAIADTGPFDYNRDYSTADTPSKLNANSHNLKPAMRNAMEKFVFEQLAFDPSANLRETDAEKLFGFKNNDASRFVGQGFTHSCVNTMANIPPEKRATVFKVFNLFCSLAETAADYQRPAKERYLVLGSRTNLLGRALKNLDKLLALDVKGQLDAKNVIKTCFPDMVAAKATGNYDLKAVTQFLESIDEALCTDPDEGGYSDIAGPLNMLMEVTGCTLKEGAEALRNGKTVPAPQYVSPGQMELGEFETLQGGRNLIGGDLYRPGNYSIVDGQQDILPPDGGFGFSFPGEERFITNGSEAGRANIQKVGDKVEALCGRVHAKQASSVMMMLSQSGLGPINRGLKGHGVLSSEHSAVDYTLSKNADTGAVTIKYSSPAELPFRFEWTSTVDVDGKVTSTPVKFEKPLDMNVGLAGKLVDDAVKATGAKLANSQRQLAVAYLAQAGTDMYAKNAGILAKFIVNLRLTDASADGDRAKIKDMAKTIGKWRDFGFDEGGMGQLNAALKTQANVILSENLASENKFSGDEPEFYSTMKTDANRATFFVNGKQVTSASDGQGTALIAALKQALPASKARKAVSALLNQENSRLLGYPQNNIAYPAGPGQAADVDVAKLPGAEKLANRNLTSGLYDQMLMGTSNPVYSVEVSKDGKTATITTSNPSTLSMGAGPDSTKSFGNFNAQFRLTIDLAADEPKVIDASFAQTLD